MDRLEFNKLELLDQIDYINKELSEGGTLTSISKEIGIGRSTLTDRFKKIKYKYSKVDNKYIYNDNKTDVTLEEYTESLKSINKTIEEPQEKNNNNITDVSLINDINIQTNLINLANEYNTIIEMIELFKKNSNILSNQIIIDLPNADSVLANFKVNKLILEQFNIFVEKNKQFKKQDLISMSIKEYMQNHKL